MHQTGNSQNVPFDTNYKHNVQRVFEFFWIHDPIQPTKNPIGLNLYPYPPFLIQSSIKIALHSCRSSSLFPRPNSNFRLGLPLVYLYVDYVHIPLYT